MSDGYTGVLYFRNAPGLFNAAARNYYMWDGRLDGSDQGTLVRDMLTEAHTMNMDSRLAQERLKQVPEYAELFEDGWGGDPYGGKIYGAIGEFLKTIRTVNAPFDAYLRGEDSAIDDAAKRGMELFAGKAGCSQCHSGAMLSDGGLHALGVPDHPELIGATAAGNAGHAGHSGPTSANPTADRQIAMLRHFATMGTPNYMNLRTDVGHYVVTKDKSDIGKFVTPSLWDVEQTAHYMHSGVFDTLEEVVEFYNAGGGEGANKTELLKPLGLNANEKADLVEFLKSLTGDAPAVTIPELPEYQLREVGKN
jgi:cytochrome c peroxidase